MTQLNPPASVHLLARAGRRPDGPSHFAYRRGTRCPKLARW